MFYLWHKVPNVVEPIQEILQRVNNRVENQPNHIYSWWLAMCIHFTYSLYVFLLAIGTAKRGNKSWHQMNASMFLLMIKIKYTMHENVFKHWCVWTYEWMYEWMNKWVELSQLHDFFRAFLADFCRKKMHDLRTEGKTNPLKEMRKRILQGRINGWTVACDWAGAVIRVSRKKVSKKL